MNALLVYPRFPDTYWSFRYALSFQGKRAAQPPLGLMTVAALLPASWNKRLIDTNVERLKDSDLAWADVVLLGGMQAQQQDLTSIIRRCRTRGVRTIVGGPITSSLPAAALGSDCVVIGEAENLIVRLARDLESGSLDPVYQSEGYPSMEHSPLPDLSLIRMKRYSTMAVQYSRGCPFNCEFCDIIEIYGRRPRTKAIAQVLAEFDQLYAAGWRGPVFIVDDNFIGNKVRVRDLLLAMTEWQKGHGHPFRFITEASLNLADDRELLQSMKDAGFTAVFLGPRLPTNRASKPQTSCRTHGVTCWKASPPSRNMGSKSWGDSFWASIPTAKTSLTGSWSLFRRARFQLPWSGFFKPYPAHSFFDG